MTDLRICVLAICATAFALTFIVLIAVYGGHAARCLALTAAFLGVVSQFAAQDANAQRQSLVASYLGFFASIAALVTFWAGS